MQSFIVEIRFFAEYEIPYVRRIAWNDKHNFYFSTSFGERMWPFACDYVKTNIYTFLWSYATHIVKEEERSLSLQFLI